MKIDLSKYPPGTKFKLKNGETVVLVGKSYISDDYLIEHIRDEYHIPDRPAVTYRRQNGTAENITEKYDIESVIQPDKYLVSFLTYGQEQKTQIVEDPKRLTEKYFLGKLLGPLTDDDSFFKPKGEGKTRIKDLPYKVLSWSKIEE